MINECHNKKGLYDTTTLGVMCHRGAQTQLAISVFVSLFCVFCVYVSNNKDKRLFPFFITHHSVNIDTSCQNILICSELFVRCVLTDILDSRFFLCSY